MLFYYQIYILLSSQLFIGNKYKKYLAVCSGFLLFFIAAFRSGDVVKDYYGYIEYYDSIANKSFVVVEPTFILIATIVNSISGSSLYLFVFYAALGVFLKIFSIYRLTKYYLLSIIIYYTNFFLVHEMTQIRAGVAAGLFLFSIPYIKNKKPLKFLFVAVISACFHFTSIVMVPFYYLSITNLNKIMYSLLIPVAYAIYYANIDLFWFINYIPIPLLQMKYTSYSLYASEDSSINLFNFIHLSRCLLAYLLLWKCRLINSVNDYSVILIKIYIISIFIFVAFARNPAISSRVSELLMIVEVIIIPLLIVAFRCKNYIKVLALAIGLAFLTFNLFYLKLLNAFQFIDVGNNVVK